MPSATYGFLGNPETVTVITSGSSTVAAGKYAYVTAQVTAGGELEIDGDVALTSNNDSWNAISSSNSPDRDSTGNKLMVNTGALVGSAAAVFTNVTARARTSVAASYWVPTGTSIEITGTGAAVIQIFPE